MRRDMRRLNKVSQACNPQGHWYTYGQVGTGKNSLIVTLSSGAMADYYSRYVGELWKNLKGGVERG